MATPLEYLSLINEIDEPREQDLTLVKNEPTVSDYIADIVRAPVGGVSDAIQGLLTLGAIPIDYLANTNLTKKIDDVFDKYAPDARTGIGEVVQTLTQFGVPLGVASKLGTGMKILKAGNVRKLSSLPTIGAKGAELAKRAGYFGAIGGAVDLAVSNPGDNITLSETLGFSESKDLDTLEGRERATELFKQKIRFGTEGAIVGGAIPLLPTAGSLGYKYGIQPVAKKVVGPVLGKTLTVLDKTVVNPLSVAIAGKGTKSLASDIIQKGGGLLKKGIEKTGLPPSSEWKYFDTKTGSYGQRILKTLDNLKNQFTTSGILSPSLKAEGTKIASKIESEMKGFARIADRIDNTLEDIVSKYKFNVYDKLTGSNKFHNIDDALQAEKNKVFDYLQAQGPNAQKRALSQINPAVQNEAKQLKEILKESNTQYGNLLSKSSSESYKELSKLFIEDADNLFKQRFAAFDNKKFQYDPLTGTIGKRAVQEIKNIIMKNNDMKRTVANQTSEQLAKLGGKGNYQELFEKNLQSLAETKIQGIKHAAIHSGSNPEMYTNALAKILDTQVISLTRPQRNFPDAIKDFITTPKGRTVPVKDYRNSIIDALVWNSKQTYSKNYFDEVLKEWTKTGVIVSNQLDSSGNIIKSWENVALERGIDPLRLRRIKPADKVPMKGEIDPATGKVKTDVQPMYESKLFEDEYFTLPEISHALQETKVGFDRLFDVPFYKTLMTLKAGGQIAKTIFSPMTQIRNVTTASFFPLASGLIGSRSSVGDAWKLVAEDIFTGAKTNLSKLNSEIDDMITRGVIDQNIQVNEIRTILNKAKDGMLSFESFMNNPTVKKFVDVYQGGDNLWKVYADKFYQSALNDAFSYVSPAQAARGLKGGTDDLILENVKDWYRTVAKENFIETSIITGQKKTGAEALKEVSAYLVTNTIPTYSKVPNIIKNLRTLPLGNFVAFPAEIMRTSANLLALGAKELTSTNPFIRQMGARRLIGASATFGGIGKVVSETAQYVTGVDDDKMDSARRSFLPTYEKNATLIPLSAPDKDGKFKYFNFSYSNPYDSLVRPFNAVVSAYGDGKLNKDSAERIVMSALFGDPVSDRPGAISEFFAPFLTESIGTERVADVILREGKKRGGGIVYSPQDPLDVKIAKSLDHIMGGLTPGAFTQASRVWEGATGQFTDAGTARNTRDELMAMMSGIRVQEVKPLSSMPFIITSYGKDRTDISSKFGRVAYSANESLPNKLSAYKTYLLESYDSQNKMFRTLKDAQNLGIDDYELKKILEDRLTKSDTKRLLDGTFKVPTFSEERFDALVRRVETENPEAAIQLESNNEILKEVFKDIRTELKYYDLNRGLETLSDYLDRLLSPGAERAEAAPVRLAPVTRTTEQTPNLPSQISGTPVNTGVISNQNLGQRFNISQDPRFNILFPRG